MNKDFKDNITNVISILMMIVASFFGALVATGFDFSFNTFTKPAFYIATVISFGIMMYSYNFSKQMFIVTLKKNADKDYYKNKQRENNFIKFVRDNHLEDRVEEATKKLTERNRIEAAQIILDNITYGLKVSDVEDLDNPQNIAINKNSFNDFVIKRAMNKKEKKKLSKALSRILNGKYYYEVVTIKDILIDNSNVPKYRNKIKVNTAHLEAKENRTKALMFIISTTLTNSLIWNGFNDKLLASLLTQIMLIVTTIISAFTVANRRVNLLAWISDNKCDFLNQALKNESLGN